MSPTTRVGESDPEPGDRPRGGHPRSLRGAGGAGHRGGFGHRAGHGAPSGRRGGGGGLPRRGRRRHRSRGGRDQRRGRRGRRAGHRAALRRHRRGRRRRVPWSRAGEELGPITNLCNIAGIGGFAHTPEQSLSGWDKIIAVNLTGTFLMCRAVLPGMLEHGGAIVNTVSTAGVIGQPYSAAYCASKGGVKMLTKALAVEYMARGVRVNGVAPGGVDTPIIHNFGPPDDADFKLIERLMTPDRFRLPARDRRSVRLPRFARGGLRHRGDPLHRRGDHDLSTVDTSRAAEPARLRVALDATPLLGLPTGVGAFCRGALAALAQRPGVDVRAYAVSWRRRRLIEAHLPGGRRRPPAPDAGPAPARAVGTLGRAAAGVVHRRRRRRARDELPGAADRPRRRRGLGARPHAAASPRAVRRGDARLPGLIRRALGRGAWVHTDSAFVAGEVVEAFGADPSRVRVVHPGIPDLPARRRRRRPTAALRPPAPSRDRALLPGRRDGRAAQGPAGPGARLRRGGRPPRRRRARPGRAAGVGRGGAGLGRRRVAGAGTGSSARAGSTQPDLAALLSGASVLAYPSLYEGFGFPPLQAMRAGVPVVATRAGSLPEVLGDGAAAGRGRRPRRPRRRARRAAWATRRERRRLIAAGTAWSARYLVGALRRRARGALPRRGGRPWLRRPHRRCCSPSSSSGGGCPAASAPTRAGCSAGLAERRRGGRRRRGDAAGQPGTRPGAADPLAAFGRPIHTSRLPDPLLTRAWDHGLSRAPAGFDIVHSVSLAAPRLRALGRRTAGRDRPRRGLAPPPRGDDTARGRAGTRRRSGASPGRVRRWSSRPGWWRPTCWRWGSTAAGSRSCPAVPTICPPPTPTATDALLRRVGVSGEFLLTVGTLEPRKNVDRLVEAFRQVRRSLPEALAPPDRGPGRLGPRAGGTPGRGPRRLHRRRLRRRPGRALPPGPRLRLRPADRGLRIAAAGGDARRRPDRGVRTKCRACTTSARRNPRPPAWWTRSTSTTSPPGSPRS